MTAAVKYIELSIFFGKILGFGFKTTSIISNGVPFATPFFKSMFWVIIPQLPLIKKKVPRHVT